MVLTANEDRSLTKPAGGAGRFSFLSLASMARSRMTKPAGVAGRFSFLSLASTARSRMTVMEGPNPLEP